MSENGCTENERRTTVTLKEDGQCLPNLSGTETLAEERRLTILASQFITASDCTGSKIDSNNNAYNVMWREGKDMVDSLGNKVVQEIVLSSPVDVNGNLTARCEPGTSKGEVADTASTSNGSKSECEGPLNAPNGRVYFPSGVEATKINAAMELKQLGDTIRSLDPSWTYSPPTPPTSN